MKISKQQLDQAFDELPKDPPAGVRYLSYPGKKPSSKLPIDFAGQLFFSWDPLLRQWSLIVITVGLKN